jgi:hypothetical protein
MLTWTLNGETCHQMSRCGDKTRQSQSRIAVNGVYEVITTLTRTLFILMLTELLVAQFIATISYLALQFYTRENWITIHWEKLRTED